MGSVQEEVPALAHHVWSHVIPSSLSRQMIVQIRQRAHIDCHINSCLKRLQSRGHRLCISSNWCIASFQWPPSPQAVSAPEHVLETTLCLAAKADLPLCEHRTYRGHKTISILLLSWPFQPYQRAVWSLNLSLSSLFLHGIYSVHWASPGREGPC